MALKCNKSYCNYLLSTIKVHTSDKYLRYKHAGLSSVNLHRNGYDRRFINEKYKYLQCLHSIDKFVQRAIHTASISSNL